MAESPVKTSFFKRTRNALGYLVGGRNEFYPGGHTDQRRMVASQKLARDIMDLMCEHRQRMLIGDGRYIYQAFSPVHGMVDQRADYVYDGSWRLQSLSSDREFAKAVEEDFKKIDSQLDMRGAGFSFRRNVWRTCKALDVDGDLFVLLTEDPKTGFPLLQYIEAHNVGSFDNGNEPIVQSGKYKGRRINNGVILDPYSRPIAYRVRNYSADGAGWRDVPARSIVPFVDLKWFSQNRGTPSVCAGILDWYDLAETRDAEKIAQKISSSLTLIESNESGNIDTGSATVNPSPRASGGLQTQLMDSGMVRYIKNGGSIEAHESRRPSDGWMNFEKLVSQGAFYAARWRREMFDGEQLARAGARGVVNDINHSISSRCEVIAPPMQRIALYIIAKRAKMGIYDLPADWYKIAFTKPAEFTVDEGRMRKADLDDLRAGLTTETNIVERRGHDHEELVRQRAKEIKRREEIAEEFGIDPHQLGTLQKPGDPIPLDLQPNSNDS